MNTFNEYQAFTQKKAAYNTDIDLYTGDIWTSDNGTVEVAHKMAYLYPVLALAEEAGEVAGKVAKFVRKSRTSTNFEELRENVKKELGDVLYNVSETARMFGFTLQDIVDAHVEKLDDRQVRGVLIGEGDNR